VTANCFHPGFVATGFNRNNGTLMNLGMTILRPVARSPEKGAKTLVWLATSLAVADVSGVYFFDQEQTPPSPEAKDTDKTAVGDQRSAVRDLATKRRTPLMTGPAKQVCKTLLEVNRRRRLRALRRLGAWCRPLEQVYMLSPVDRVGGGDSRSELMGERPRCDRYDHHRQCKNYREPKSKAV
jgi:hypothetical protein